MLFHPPVYFGVCIIIAIYTPVLEEPEEVGHTHVHVTYFSCEDISHNTEISTGGVEWGRVNIWITPHISFKVVYSL